MYPCQPRLPCHGKARRSGCGRGWAGSILGDGGWICFDPEIRCDLVAFRWLVHKSIDPNIVGFCLRCTSALWVSNKQSPLTNILPLPSPPRRPQHPHAALHLDRATTATATTAAATTSMLPSTAAASSAAMPALGPSGAAAASEIGSELFAEVDYSSYGYFPPQLVQFAGADDRPDDLRGIGIGSSIQLRHHPYRDAGPIGAGSDGEFDEESHSGSPRHSALSESNDYGDDHDDDDDESSSESLFRPQRGISSNRPSPRTSTSPPRSNTGAGPSPPEEQAVAVRPRDAHPFTSGPNNQRGRVPPPTVITTSHLPLLLPRPPPMPPPYVHAQYLQPPPPPQPAPSPSGASNRMHQYTFGFHPTPYSWAPPYGGRPEDQMPNPAARLPGSVEIRTMASPASASAARLSHSSTSSSAAPATAGGAAAAQGDTRKGAKQTAKSSELSRPAIATAAEPATPPEFDKQSEPNNQSSPAAMTFVPAALFQSSPPMHGSFGMDTPQRQYDPAHSHMFEEDEPLSPMDQGFEDEGFARDMSFLSSNPADLYERQALLHPGQPLPASSVAPTGTALAPHNPTAAMLQNFSPVAMSTSVGRSPTASAVLSSSRGGRVPRRSLSAARSPSQEVDYTQGRPLQRALVGSARGRSPRVALDFSRGRPSTVGPNRATRPAYSPAAAAPATAPPAPRRLSPTRRRLYDDPTMPYQSSPFPSPYIPPPGSVAEQPAGMHFPDSMRHPTQHPMPHGGRPYPPHLPTHHGFPPPPPMYRPPSLVTAGHGTMPHRYPSYPPPPQPYGFPPYVPPPPGRYAPSRPNSSRPVPPSRAIGLPPEKKVDTDKENSARKAGEAVATPTAAFSGKAKPVASPRGRRPVCHCKKSQCLKLYCECFSAEIFCFGCKCTDCFNVPECQYERDRAIADIRHKNPQAFKPRVATETHTLGCKCKKSECLKKVRPYLPDLNRIRRFCLPLTDSLFCSIVSALRRTSCALANASAEIARMWLALRS
jgi:Tesmin/TSO1-like CXC domain, cysteine-rich domain